MGLKDGAVIAFAFLEKGEEFGEPVFSVDWSSYEDNFDMDGADE